MPELPARYATGQSCLDRPLEQTPADVVGPARGGAALSAAGRDLLGRAAVPDVGMSRSRRDGRGRDEDKGQEEEGIPEFLLHRFLLGGRSACTSTRSGTSGTSPRKKVLAAA